MSEPSYEQASRDAHVRDERPEVAVTRDPLLDVRAELEIVEELPVAERAEVFERAHSVVVGELRQLELG